MKTNIKVTAIGLSGVLLLGGLIANFGSTGAKSPKGLKVSEDPIKVLSSEAVEHYGIMIEGTVGAYRKAEQVHLHCITTSETGKECKTRLGYIVSSGVE